MGARPVAIGDRHVAAAETSVTSASDSGTAPSNAGLKGTDLAPNNCTNDGLHPYLSWASLRLCSRPASTDESLRAGRIIRCGSAECRNGRDDWIDAAGRKLQNRP